VLVQTALTQFSLLLHPQVAVVVALEMEAQMLTVQTVVLVAVLDITQRLLEMEIHLQ
jgi:hypothetical protein